MLCTRGFESHPRRSKIYIYLIKTVLRKKVLRQKILKISREKTGLRRVLLRVLLNIILIKEDKMDDIDIGERIKKIVKLCL